MWIPANFCCKKEGVRHTAGLPAESITVFCRRAKLIIVIIQVPGGLLSGGAAVPRIHGWRGSTRRSLLPQCLPLWACARVCMCARVVAGTAFVARCLQATEREGTLIWSKNIFASLHFSLQLRHLNRVFTAMPLHSHLQTLLGLSVKAATFKSPPRRQNALECNVFTWNWFLRCSCQRKQRYPRRTGQQTDSSVFFHSYCSLSAIRISLLLLITNLFIF